MAKVPKKVEMSNGDPCLGRVYRTHRPFSVQVQILDTYFTKFRQKHGFHAQQISKFEIDRTNFNPPLSSTPWLHNFAPEDLYWIHSVSINKKGEWTAKDVTLCEQKQRSTVMGVVVIPLLQERDNAQADLYVNTAELDDSAFGIKAHFKTNDQRKVQTGDIVICQVVPTIKNSAKKVTFPYTIVSAEILHDYENHFQPPLSLPKEESIKRQSRLLMNLLAHESKIQQRQEDHQELRGILHWTDVRAPLLKGLFQENPQRLANKTPLKLRIGDEVKIHFHGSHPPCIAIVDENVGIVNDMEFSFIIEGCAAIDLVAKGYVQKPARIRVFPLSNTQHQKRIKRFIEKWEEMVQDDGSSETFKTMFEALFHLKPIPPDHNLENTVTSGEMTFPGFVPNDDQLMVAQKVVKGTEPVLNIEGPPGTGKTSLAIAIIRLLVKKNPDVRILVCGPSNKSADRVVELLNKMLTESSDIDDSTLRVLRVYSTPLEQIQKSGEVPNALHVLAEKLTPGNRHELEDLKMKQDELELLQGEGPEEVRGFTQKAHDLIKEISEIRKRLQAICFETRQPNVVVTTCYGSGSHWLQGYNFTHVIVDEVGQAQIVEALFACTQISKMHAKQVILVGDRHQLTPIILSIGVAGLILSTCLSATLEDSRMVLRIRLRRCYRMHPCMLRFINYATYNMELFTTLTPADRASIARVFSFPVPDEPQVFFEVLGAESQSPNQPSRWNDAEVEVVVEIIRQLVTECEISIFDVAALSFYEAQRRAIANRLLEVGLLRSLVEARSIVANVDSFQGREKEVIVLSCVRSSPQGERVDIGFLKSPNRANVAMTRARSALIIVGNPHTLYIDDYWRELIEAFAARNQIVPFFRNY